ncbi:MAG: HAMP domain-containing histidine kinase [Bacteroidetes bacterium]|nr:HAMP domain-containing histidine kinase [Bacteroidota bacterium]
MVEAIVIGLLLAVVLVILSRALVKTRRQAKLMRLQSEEIQKHVLQIEQRNEELIKLNREKLQIVSLVSHDLKGPFNRIFALIQLMNLGKSNLTDEQKEYLDKIHQIAADGLGMIRNLLDHRRLEDKGIELNEIVLDFNALATSLVKNYRSIAEKKSIDIEYQSTGTILIKADKLYLSRVIENLLSNAIKFSADHKKVFVQLELLSDDIQLTIRDEGPGISEEDQAKLFQRFQKLTARPTGGESSTGLGLFIVKTILEKLGGTIECQSVLGEGASFVVRLPKKNFSIS